MAMKIRSLFDGEEGTTTAVILLSRFEELQKVRFSKFHYFLHRYTSLIVISSSQSIDESNTLIFVSSYEALVTRYHDDDCRIPSLTV
ncbi:hypothetical protein L1987_16092 [Smallanthus sonchifolius]|uniref:Uncharacterized protein n=1 Tax=Smallanthus sonchifolius TaxID=185202 RepID=A0ACB9J7E8_9ASTR|nr:hypothetical protein L1987_16092 [Smallanthus sonchifolius]